MFRIAPSAAFSGAYCNKVGYTWLSGAEYYTDSVDTIKF